MESNQPIPISRYELRQIVGGGIAASIEIHRTSRAHYGEGYARPLGAPTDDEIDDFILSNPLFEHERAKQITDPARIGLGQGHATGDAVAEFQEQTHQWATANEWLGANLVFYQLDENEIDPSPTTKLWLPTQTRPEWVKRSRATVLLFELLHNQQPLSEFTPRQFEEAFGHILERERWHVDVTRGSRDGGIDLIASCGDPAIERVRSVWRAKRCSLDNKVGLTGVRELSGLVYSSSATKGVAVTTSHLAQGALGWVRQDVYRLPYKNNGQIEEWIERHT